MRGRVYIRVSLTGRDRRAPCANRQAMQTQVGTYLNIFRVCFYYSQLRSLL